MSNGLQAVSEAALKTWGGLALAALFMIGAYFYLINKDTLEHERFEARQVREGALVALLKQQHETLATTWGPALATMDKKLSRLDERGDAWITMLGALRTAIDSQSAIVQTISARQDNFVPIINELLRLERRQAGVEGKAERNAANPDIAPGRASP